MTDKKKPVELKDDNPTTGSVNREGVSNEEVIKKGSRINSDSIFELKLRDVLICLTAFVTCLYTAYNFRSEVTGLNRMVEESNKKLFSSLNIDSLLNRSERFKSLEKGFQKHKAEKTH